MVCRRVWVIPSYTLGAVAAAQLYAAARAQAPDIVGAVGRGEFGPLLNWLRANVHSLGARYDRDATLRLGTGRPLAVGDFEAHLRARYLDKAAD